ncbi:unnamed protein product [Caenorhabditis auriculariae]|uniref:Uncharacterized protein n=1 Tax=Caenorhabditis auriculariae TaxID=2777116 RepID=A0A8S1H7I9_9PELO|nr:unnamed protein product [Caenorhabditis auriculariae]
MNSLILSKKSFILYFGYAFLISYSSAAVSGPLTPDFQNWLVSHGYEKDDFVRSDQGTQGSYGGFTNTSKIVKNVPVVFIHGNSDSALQTSSFATGWSNSVEYFLSQGYTTAELYATSWQDTNFLKASLRTHNCRDLLRLRRFLEAVLAYTGSSKLSIVSHSMGVTLGRKIVKGGSVNAADGNCDLGKPINRNVEVFVGIAGANFGLCNCQGVEHVEKTCNKQNGFFPGDSCGANTLNCGTHPLPKPCNGPTYSTLLSQMNSDNMKEADYVFSTWSHVDDLIQFNDMTWGRPTSLIPTSDAFHEYPSYTHMQTKEQTAPDQYQMVKNKKIPS